MAENDDEQTQRTLSGQNARSRLMLFVPLAAFLCLCVIFVSLLSIPRDRSNMISAMIGQPAPPIDLPAIPHLILGGLEISGIKISDFRGEITLLNFFASWCAPCRLEHDALIRLSKDQNIQLIGINHRDKAGNARRYLGAMGNPFTKIGFDPNARSAVDWGVYGIPETFIIDREGIIRYKKVGPITDTVLEEDILPLIAKLKREKSPNAYPQKVVDPISR